MTGFALTLRDGSELDPGSSVIRPRLDVLSGAIEGDIAQAGGLSFVAPRSARGVPDALPGRLVVLEARGQRLEYWISGRRDRMGSELVSITCDPFHVLLHDVGVLDWLGSDGVSHVNLGGPDAGMSLRNFWFTFLRPFLRRHGKTWIELGDVDSDERLVHSWEALSPQGVATALVQQLRREWRLRRDDATGSYLFDVGENLGEDATPSWAAEGLNLITLERAFDREEMATVVRPIGTLSTGAPADVSLALWRVSAVNGNTVTLEPHANVAGSGPVLEDEQWVGAYLEAPDGGTHEITDSSGEDDSVTLVSGGADFAENDEVRFVASAAGAPIVEVTSPRGIEVFGRMAVGQRLPFFSRSAVELASLLEWTDEQLISVGITSTTNINSPTESASITVGDAAIMASWDQWAFVAALNGRVDLDRTVQNGQRALVPIPSLIGGWAFANDSGGPLAVLRRNTGRATGSVTGQQATSGAPASGFSFSGIGSGTRLEPGDVIYRTSSYTAFVATPGEADASGDLADVSGINAYRKNSTNGWGGSVTIYRPALSSLLGHVPFILSSYRSRNTEIDLPTVQIAPRSGASLYARLKFTAIASRSDSSGWDVLPRLQIMQGSTVVGTIETDNWTPTAEGQTVDRTLALGPIDVDAAAEFHLRIRPGWGGNTGSTYRMSVFGIFVTEAILYIGLDAPGDDATPLVPEAAVGIQLANRELNRRRRWRSRYSCSLTELAEALKVRPEIVRTMIGASIRIRSRTMNLDNSFRITGVSWSPLSERTEVELDSVGYRLTSALGEREDDSLFVRETGQRVSSQPPATGFYRAVEVPDAGLSADDPIDVELA